MFKKREWSKYEHVMFIEHFTGGIKTYELLRKVDAISGETKYKQIYVGSHVHRLSGMLTNWYKGTD